MTRVLARIAANPLSLAMTLFFLLLFLYMVAESRDYPRLARIFPQNIGIIGLVLAVLELVRQLIRSDRQEGPDYSDLQAETELPPAAVYRGAALYFGWIGVYYALIWLVGFVAGTGLFSFGLLRMYRGGSLIGQIALAAAAVAVAYGLSIALSLHWPDTIWVRR